MWNAERGFGFIADDSGGPDMFLHSERSWKIGSLKALAAWKAKGK
jgi:cold shock CspA family protein